MQDFFWAPVIRPLLEAIGARHVVQIGAGEGLTTTKIARWCVQNSAVVDVVDPGPSFDPAELSAEFGGSSQFHQAISLDVLSSLLPADAVLVGGDHNWHTVFHELQTIYSAQDALHDAPVVVCSHTSWPYGRRDRYDFPETIPETARRPMRRGGVMPGEKNLVPNGLNKDRWHAEVEGGSRNGVRTAIMDALAPYGDDLAVAWVDALFGLAVIAPRGKLRAFQPLRALFDELALTRTWKAIVTVSERQRALGVIARQNVSSLLGTDTPFRVQRPYRSSLSRDQALGVQGGAMKGAYKGRRMLLNPFDMAIYQTLLEELQPRTIFEIGVFEGGRTLWLADGLRNYQLDARVIAVDREQPAPFADPLITFLRGDALKLDDVLGELLEGDLPRPFLVIEDSAHDFATTTHVLDFFDDHMRPGDFIVVEDGDSAQLIDVDGTSAVSRAIDEFLARKPEAYAIETRLCDLFGFNMTNNPNGWLKRI